MTGRGAWWAATGLLCAVLLAPLLIADVPPVLDYPNHLARFVLLAAGPDDPVLGAIAAPHWAIIPNLAADAIGPALLRLLPVHVAGRCLLGFILLLNLAGVVALHRALFGRRSLWPLASGLVAYNSTFLLGFLNWQIGSGLAMLFAAAWLAWRERWPVATVAGASAASVVLFFCHLMGLLFFLVLIGSAEAHAMWRRRGVLVGAAALLPVLLGPALLMALSALQSEPAAADWMDLPAKLVQTASPFVNYHFPLDAVSAALVYGGIAAAVAARWLVPAPRAVPAVVALVILYIVLPFNLKGASFVDTRLVIMLGFLLFAAFDPVGLPRRAGRVVAGGLAALLAVRMAVLADVWLDQRRDLAELRSVIGAVPPGALVYVTDVPREEAPEYWNTGPRNRLISNVLRTENHLPALLLIERRAFWPGLFVNPAQQPIRLLPAYARLAREAYDMPSHAALATDPDRSAAALRDFDFVLLLEAGADPDPSGFIPRCLSLVSRTDFAALYRVRHETGACAAGP